MFSSSLILGFSPRTIATDSLISLSCSDTSFGFYTFLSRSFLGLNAFFAHPLLRKLLISPFPLLSTQARFPFKVATWFLFMF
jgi:hypothetical protein